MKNKEMIKLQYNAPQVWIVLLRSEDIMQLSIDPFLGEDDPLNPQTYGLEPL